MRRVAVSLVALTTLSTGVAIGIGDRAAWACSCVPSTPAEHAARADVVFTGTLTEVGRPEAIGGNVTLVFDVATVYRGTAAPVQEVVTGPMNDSCTMGFAQLGDWLVFAAAEVGYIDDWMPDTLYTGYCSGSAPWDGSTVATGLTGPGTAPTTDAAPTTVPSPAPTPTPITPPPRTSPDDGGWSLNDWLLAAVIAVPVVAMLGLGLALYVRRRR